MSSLKPSSRAKQLLQHHRLRGRSYPTQRYWDRLYQMLEEEAEKRGRTPPPPPPGYALDHELTDDDRIECLREQLAWADRNNLLHRNSMPPIVQKNENIAGPGQGGILTFNANDITPSSYVGLTPQLLAFDPKTNGGFSTGLTTGKLVAPGTTDSYEW